MKTKNHRKTAAQTTRTRRPVSAKRPKPTFHERRITYPFHKRVLMHPLSTFAVLLCGVFIVGWTYQVIAATVISSTIEAPPLTAAAQISVPANQTRSTSRVIVVTGSCPSASYVKLSVNGAFGGVGWCDNGNYYTIQTSLYPGQNTITPQAYNITDLPGPASDSIDIFYDAPASSVQPTTGSTQSSGNPASPPPGRTQPSAVTPLLLSSNFQFRTYTATKNFNWTVDLEGGMPPYHVKVDWGDNTSSNYSFAADPVFNITHVYHTPGYYPVTLSSTDAAGSQQVMQLAALITGSAGQAPFLPTSQPAVSLPGSSPSHTLVTTAKWLLVAWPIYLVIMLMTFSFWLGERREFLTLKTRH